MIFQDRQNLSVDKQTKGLRAIPNTKTCPLLEEHYIMPNIVEKKEKKPSKKEVITDIENLDTEKRFDIKSLMRTNID